MKINARIAAEFLARRRDLDTRQTLDLLQERLPLTVRLRTAQEKAAQAETLRDLANHLGIPHEFRTSITVLRDFLHQLRMHLSRRFEVLGKGIRVGDAVIFHGRLYAEVVKVHDTFHLTLELRDRRKVAATPSVVTKR